VDEERYFDRLSNKKEVICHCGPSANVCRCGKAILIGTGQFGRVYLFDGMVYKLATYTPDAEKEAEILNKVRGFFWNYWLRHLL
jgi:hypothetical protein